MSKAIYDFEDIYREFEEVNRTPSISHADILEVEGARCTVVERTLYVNKDLTNPKVYRKEVAEIVKKMWGSFTVLVWWCGAKGVKLPPERIFCIQCHVSHSKFSKILKDMLKELKDYKNGAYKGLKLEEKKSLPRNASKEPAGS